MKLSLRDLLRIPDVPEDSQELLELLQAEVEERRMVGDTLGAGEALLAQLPILGAEGGREAVLAKLISAWSSPTAFSIVPSSVADLIDRFDAFDPEFIAIATVHAVARSDYEPGEVPTELSDVAYRVSSVLQELFETGEARHTAVLSRARATLTGAWAEFAEAADAFTQTAGSTAKPASIDVLRTAHRLRRFALAGERRMIAQVDVLFGPSFRKFCEAFERKEMEGIRKRLSDVQDAAKKYLTLGQDVRSALWTSTLEPMALHVLRLAREADQQSEAAVSPELSVTNKLIKTDLTGGHIVIGCTLVNLGAGRADNVQVEAGSKFAGSVQLHEPQPGFALGSGDEMRVTLGIDLPRVKKKGRATVPLVWKCTSVTGSTHRNDDDLYIRQQEDEPDWEALADSAPYTFNPISSKDKLYGRTSTLDQLYLSAAARNSMFLWGQKRVGKTSLVQVLARDLETRSGYHCQILRMGELKGMDESEIALRIGRGMTAASGEMFEEPPSPETTRRGLASLVPFFEALQRSNPDHRHIVIIDEFEDLDASIYSGDRGAVFFKALRSLSELGAVFFLVGSEKMEAIWAKRATELNKWTDYHLDRLESWEDCKALIEAPLQGAIEYEKAAVDDIIEYCGENPFYMHLLCSDLFQRSWRDRKTYISATDVSHSKESVVRKAGVHNFAHFWTDNPVLDEAEQERFAAENALALACLSYRGGSVVDHYELAAAQEELGLRDEHRLGTIQILRAVERLIRRGVLESESNSLSITLPIFQDWLNRNADTVLLPAWREYAARADSGQGASIETSFFMESRTFPISEDRMLPVAQRLDYLGKQKDVAELRQWLQQFDDEVRIELAFALLERLAEEGYVSEGRRTRAVGVIHDAVLDKRKNTGGGEWSEIRGRRDDLCIGFVDAEHKSGGTTARVFQKRLRPSKVGEISSLGQWASARPDKDALILIVDDFIGSGATISKGLKALLEGPNAEHVDSFLEQGRVLCCALFAFPEGLDLIKSEHPRIEVMSANVFGSEVRALDPDADLFANAQELEVAKSMLEAIGRELVPAMPLGWKEMATLVAFQNTVPNNTLPVFWSSGMYGGRQWNPLFPRA